MNDHQDTARKLLVRVYALLISAQSADGPPVDFFDVAAELLTDIQVYLKEEN